MNGYVHILNEGCLSFLCNCVMYKKGEQAYFLHFQLCIKKLNSIINGFSLTIYASKNVLYFHYCKHKHCTLLNSPASLHHAPLHESVKNKFV